MKILSISATVENGNSMVYGLGDDGQTYFWNPVDTKWELWKN